MAASTTDALFVTANVGSIFEDPTLMLKIWCDEFLATVSKLAPKFVALHCQEVGGKNYERSMQHVADFVKLLLSSEELKRFNKVRIFLDEDYSSAEHFTALGNFYFIHESISEDNIEIFNFQEKKFEPVHGKEVYSENIEEVATKEKSKFPQEFFPECKWSRKGFMRTRWNLNGTIFDLINIHLFHDASNFVAMESFPSVYCKNRQRALEHTLKRFHTDQYGIVPFFVFGDFNFRTDTQGVVKKLSEGLNAVKVPSNKTTDHAKLQYRNESSQEVVFTLGKKEFSHQDHQKLFVGDESEWLREFDRELESFSGQLFEFSIDFPPTYPYVEDSERGELYMQTRCPSWCDRVFFSSSARLLVDCTNEENAPEYGLMGQNACMGDHKPVFLRATLLGGLGTVSCCALPALPCTSCLSAATPLENICRLCSELSVESSSFPLFAEPEQDHSGLVVPQIHRYTTPYTPDSTDTEPDLGEELSPSEEPLYQKSRTDRRLNRADIHSRKRLHIGTSENVEEDCSIQSGLSCRKSMSKIPIRVPEAKENVLSMSSMSKIPVLRHPVSKHENDFMLNHRNSKHTSVPSSAPMHCTDRRLAQQRDGDVFRLDSESSPKPVQSTSDSARKPQSLDGRKQVSREIDIDEQSSDSEAGSLELGDKQFLRSDQRANETILDEPKVEIQLSLVEASPNMLSPIGCDAVGLLTTKSHGLGGSTTDSGVSVSPDLSGATSPSTDEPDKAIRESVVDDSTDIDDCKTVVDPLSLDRFTFVRRIQSASAMERKSSFPLPSTLLMENQEDFGGSGSNLWEMRTCRCMSDSSWRQRSTVSHSLLNSKTGSRIRLISTSSHLDRSLPRLQSHHSSSEEDWFEEIVCESGDGSEHAVNHKDVLVLQNVADRGNRLPTHQEYIPGQSSDLKVQFDPSLDKIVKKPVSSPASKQQKECDVQVEPDSIRAVAAVGKTLAQTCFVDTERDSKGGESETSPRECTIDVNILDAKELPLSKIPECQLVKGEEFPQVNNSSAVPLDLTVSPVKSMVASRRPSVTSGNSKPQNSSSCKACCILM